VVDTIVTDGGIDPEIAKELTSRGIKLCITGETR
jgi:hypothetical protein